MRHRFKALTLPQLKHVGFSVQRMVFAVEIARFGAMLKREADHRDRTPLALSQFGCRHQAVASGEGSAHNLTPLVPTDGGVGRENSGQGDGGAPRAVHCFKMPSLAKSPPTCDAFRRSASAMLVTPMVRSKPIVAFRKAAITSGPERLRIRLASSPIVTSRT